MLDKVMETDLTCEEVKRLLNEDPLELFEHVRDLVEEVAGAVLDVKLRNYHLKSNVSIEYYVYTKYGQVVVRISC